MGDPPASNSSGFFESAYDGAPPWDIGEPQPDLIALLDEFPPSGPVLDVGCGTGTLSLALARRGLQVLGVDGAEAAIRQAQAKAAADPEAGRLIEFRVGDALHPENLPGPFSAVVDSGFFHIFGKSERDQFAERLAKAILPGGRYYVLGFAFDSPVGRAPREVTESELRERFAPERGWRILAVRPAKFIVRRAPQGVPAIAACMERLGTST